MTDSFTQARRLFRKHGTLRTNAALAGGVHPRTLYAMRDAGQIEQLARGLFRLAELPSLSQPDLVTVAKRVPQGVICLISSLAFHHLTTQVPHRVQIALPRTARTPKLDYPPLEVFRFSAQVFRIGIERHIVDGTALQVYSAEKTLADLFKYRNKIGMDVMLEALRAYVGRRQTRFQVLLNYARACRVERAMRPYLDAMT